MPARSPSRYPSRLNRTCRPRRPRSRRRQPRMLPPADTTPTALAAAGHQTLPPLAATRPQRPRSNRHRPRHRPAHRPPPRRRRRHRRSQGPARREARRRPVHQRLTHRHLVHRRPVDRRRGAARRGGPAPPPAGRSSDAPRPGRPWRKPTRRPHTGRAGRRWHRWPRPRPTGSWIVTGSRAARRAPAASPPSRARG